MAGVEAGRDLFEKICKVTMDFPAEEFVDVETFAIEIRVQRRVFLSCGLKVDVDEEWTTGKLLHNEVASSFTNSHLLASSDMFDEFRCFGCVELFETQDVEQFEVEVCVVGRFENLAAQSGEYK